MTALPTRANFGQAGVTEANMQAAMGAVYDYLSGLFGNDGTPKTALSTLGAIAHNVVKKSAAYAVVAGDRGKLFLCEGTTWTLDLPAIATAGIGFPLIVWNRASGSIVVDGNGAEKIKSPYATDAANGDVTLTLAPGESCMLVAMDEGAGVVYWSAPLVTRQTTPAPRVRQCMLSGPVDANGFSAFGGGTGTTTVTAAGTVKVTAAAGGDTDYSGSIVNPSWTGLNTNGTMYLFLDVTAGGVVSTASGTLPFAYQWGGAYSTTNGQATFNIQEMTAKLGNGTVANQVYRVPAGEVTVAGGVVTGIVWYQLMRRYQSALAAIPSASTRTVFSHNIGIDPRFLRGKAFIRFVTGWNGYAAGQVVPFTTFYSGTNPPAIDANILESTLVAAILNNANGVQIQTPESAPTTYTALPTGSGTAQCFVDVRSDW